jgi:hypothetical protein
MAISEIYVDPSIAADSGTGTIGDPFGDLEYAIEQATFDTTNGTRVNIKAGTDEVVAVNNAVSVAMADTSVSAAWSMSATAQVVFQGYTSAAGDGGIGGISGGGTNAVFFNHNYTHLKDLHVHNCGSQIPIRLATSCSVINCEVDDSTSRGIYVTAGGVVSGNYVHDIGGSAIDANGCLIEFNLITNNGTKTCTNAISIVSNCSVLRNIISVDGVSNGITQTGALGLIEHNSIYSNGGTGDGVQWVDTNALTISISNNLIEGFSGTGGSGIAFTGAGLAVAKYGANSIFNCETVAGVPVVLSNELYGGIPGNETLSASPFVNASILDFSPVDTGAVKTAFPASFPSV